MHNVKRSGPWRLVSSQRVSSAKTHPVQISSNQTPADQRAYNASGDARYWMYYHGWSAAPFM